MGDSNADALSGSRQLETTDHTAESGDADVAAAVRNAEPPSRGPGGGSDDDERAERTERAADEHVSIRMNDRCATCNGYIEPRAFRLSRVIDTAVATLEIHYCSEACFLARDRSANSNAPDQGPGRGGDGTASRGGHRSTAAESDSQPRDWSYCR